MAGSKSEMKCIGISTEPYGVAPSRYSVFGTDLIAAKDGIQMKQ